MAKRYYITRIIGSGISTEDSYRSELMIYLKENWPNEPDRTKHSLHHRALLWSVIVYDLSDAAHTDVMADLVGIFSFPSGSLDTKVGDLTPAKRQAIRDKLENIGFEFTWANANTTIREILKYLIRSIQMASRARVPISNANFNLNTTIANVPIAARQRIVDYMQNFGIDTSWITLSHTIGDVVHRIQRNTDGSKRLFGVVKRGQLLFQDEGD